MREEETLMSSKEFNSLIKEVHIKVKKDLDRYFTFREIARRCLDERK
jgi:hypothetical protein